MRIQLSQLALSLDEAMDPRTALRAQLAQRCDCDPDALPLPTILRRSLDARGRRPPRFFYSVELDLPLGMTPPRDARLPKEKALIPVARVTPPALPPVIIGGGPAGLFCALTLAEAGVRCILLERGAKVERRKHDVAALYKRGALDPESNVNFGEGGAGTFTDGKLSTQVRNRAVREVFERLVEFGADPEIMVTHKPHLGSERLPAIVARLREHLEAAGVEFRFETRAEGLLHESNRVSGIRLDDQLPLKTDRIILAAGGSARELYRSLASLAAKQGRQGEGALCSAKDFAVGLRVEHPQALVDSIQYGQHAGHPALPPADYKLHARTTEDRGVYAFCMCPGGVVVPTPTQPERLCINGMSGSKRSSRWANSALVTELRCADLLPFEAEQRRRAGRGLASAEGAAEDTAPLLAGLRFQETLESLAYVAGGGDYQAPSSSVAAFKAKKDTLAPGRSAYPRGLAPCDLGTLFPRALADSLRQAVRRFSTLMPGFDSEEARLIGVESRTSAPLSFPRDPKGMQSPALAGLYPCGEGAGHAGGIVSAAIDGMRVGRAILQELPAA